MLGLRGGHNLCRNASLRSSINARSRVPSHVQRAALMRRGTASSSDPTSPHAPVFSANRAWAAAQTARDPSYFERLAAGQSPTYLWLGCSDSRVAEAAVAGLAPGSAFVVRNVANVFAGDAAGAAVEYGVGTLGVRHVVVCGHYGCGGVAAALEDAGAVSQGDLGSWVARVRAVRDAHAEELASLPDRKARWDRLVELNVLAQCRSLAKVPAVRKAYADRGSPIVHGWVFGLNDGLLKDLAVDFEALVREETG